MTLETQLFYVTRIGQVATEPRERLLLMQAKLVLHPGLLPARSDGSITLGYETTVLDVIGSLPSLFYYLLGYSKIILHGNLFLQDSHKFFFSFFFLREI